jgi:hypothetical protein
MSLLLGYLGVFTIGSQVSSQQFSPSNICYDAVMSVLTYRESSICILGILASCLGMWRRLNQGGSEPGTPWVLTYTTACISGLVLSSVVVGVPNAIDAGWELIDLSRAPGGPGERNYIALATLASFVSFLSGYDRTVFDRVIAIIAKRLIPGLGTESGSTLPPGAKLVPAAGHEVQRPRGPLRLVDGRRD